MFFKKKQPVPSPETPQVATPQVATPPAATAPMAIVEWDLSLLTQQIRQLAPALETKEIELALIQARLADHHRDLQLEPALPEQFDAFVHGFDAEAARRLALAVGVLDHPDIRSVLKLLAINTPAAQQVQRGFAELAKNTDALALTLIRQSDVRAEEFARHFAAYLCVSFRGESADESKQRLKQIDYKRLLAEAEDAKRSASERMEYLRKKQEEDTARRRGRGKQ